MTRARSRGVRLLSAACEHTTARNGASGLKIPSAPGPHHALGEACLDRSFHQALERLSPNRSRDVAPWREKKVTIVCAFAGNENVGPRPARRPRRRSCARNESFRLNPQAMGGDLLVPSSIASAPRSTCADAAAEKMRLPPPAKEPRQNELSACTRASTMIHRQSREWRSVNRTPCSSRS